jgi:hypothetical protein
MITEDYVSYNIAKLLKEKGFDIYCPTAYETMTSEHHVEETAFSDWGKLGQVKRPTLQMAMKWLREVHSLYLDIVTSFSQDGICYTFSCSNTMDLIQGTKGTSYHEYQTYEEACEAAIKYCLENLI